MTVRLPDNGSNHKDGSDSKTGSKFSGVDSVNPKNHAHVVPVSRNVAQGGKENGLYKPRHHYNYSNGNMDGGTTGAVASSSSCGSSSVFHDRSPIRGPVEKNNCNSLSLTPPSHSNSYQDQSQSSPTGLSGLNGYRKRSHNGNGNSILPRKDSPLPTFNYGTVNVHNSKGVVTREVLTPSPTRNSATPPRTPSRNEPSEKILLNRKKLNLNNVSPSSPGREPGVMGLNNLGNTCFLNAGMQCLLSTPSLIQFFLSMAFFPEKSEKCNLVSSFLWIMKHTWWGKRESLDIFNFKKRLGTLHNDFSDNNQHDVQEFLALFLESIHEQLKQWKTYQIQANNKLKSRTVPQSEKLLSTQGYDQAIKIHQIKSTNGNSTSTTNVDSLAEEENPITDVDCETNSAPWLRFYNRSNRKVNAVVATSSLPSTPSSQREMKVPSRRITHRTKSADSGVSSNTDSVKSCCSSSSSRDGTCSVCFSTHLRKSSDAINSDSPGSDFKSAESTRFIYPPFSPSNSQKFESRISCQSRSQSSRSSGESNSSDYMGHEVETKNISMPGHVDVRAGLKSKLVSPLSQSGSPRRIAVKSYKTKAASADPFKQRGKKPRLMEGSEGKYDAEAPNGVPVELLSKCNGNGYIQNNHEDPEQDELGKESLRRSLKGLKLTDDEISDKIHACQEDDVDDPVLVRGLPELPISTKDSNCAMALKRDIETDWDMDIAANIPVPVPCPVSPIPHASPEIQEKETHSNITIKKEKPRTAEEFWQEHLKNEDTVITRSMQGLMKSSVICSVCKFESITFDPYMDLFLPFPNRAERELPVWFVNMNIFGAESDPGVRAERYKVEIPPCPTVERIICIANITDTIGDLKYQIVEHVRDGSRLQGLDVSASGKLFLGSVVGHFVVRELFDEMTVEEISDDFNLYCYELNQNFDSLSPSPMPWSEGSLCGRDGAGTRPGSGSGHLSSNASMVTQNDTLNMSSHQASQSPEQFLEEWGEDTDRGVPGAGQDEVFEQSPSPEINKNPTWAGFPDSSLEWQSCTALGNEKILVTMDQGHEDSDDQEVASISLKYGEMSPSHSSSNPVEVPKTDLTGRVNVNSATEEKQCCHYCDTLYPCTQMIDHSNVACCGLVYCADCFEGADCFDKSRSLARSGSRKYNIYASVAAKAAAAGPAGQSKSETKATEPIEVMIPDLTPPTSTPSYSPPSVLVSNVPVVFRNSSELVGNKHSLDGEKFTVSTLFGHPWVVRIPVQMESEEFYQFFVKLNPFPGVRFRLLSVTVDGKSCGFCPLPDCLGCEYTRDSGTIYMRYQNTICMSFKDLDPQLVKLVEAPDMISECAGKESYHDYGFSKGFKFEQSYNIHDCVQAFMRTENLDADNPWHCPQCKKNQPAMKTMSIARLPDYLIICLKRFVFNANLTSTKLKNKVNFPLDNFDLKGYLASEIKEARGYMNCKYELYGCICHSGSISCGHYTAFTKNPLTHDWNYYNDSICSKGKPGEAQFSSAYALFYKRKGGAFRVPQHPPPDDTFMDSEPSQEKCAEAFSDSYSQLNAQSEFKIKRPRLNSIEESGEPLERPEPEFSRNNESSLEPGSELIPAPFPSSSTATTTETRTKGSRKGSPSIKQVKNTRKALYDDNHIRWDFWGHEIDD